MSSIFKAGAAALDFTPNKPYFLYGYPHVERNSTGVHDPLMTSALYLSDGETETLFIANDIIFVGKETTRRVRERIEAETGIPGGNVLISATHTHSGPVTVDYVSNQHDPVVPNADPEFLASWEAKMVEAAITAWKTAEPAEAGLVIADGSCVGTNRHNPEGPADPEVPVLLVRATSGDRNLACMYVCNMHPTVLHEDSTLYSGDFPGMTRQYLQEHVLGKDCPVLHHMGAAGNQSPRHVTRGNTLDEAKRLGSELGHAIESALADIAPGPIDRIQCHQVFVDLPQRTFPPVEEAEASLKTIKDRLEQLRQENAPRQEVRTAECDWFGAEETVTLAKAAESGVLQEAAQSSLPAEVQLIQVGPWTFVGWQGEVFVEFALEIRRQFPNTYIITCANGELQGYLVTAEAIENKYYEAGNALFQSPESPRRLVGVTMDALRAHNVSAEA